MQKIKQLQWVAVGLEKYTQDFAYCEIFAPEPYIIYYIDADLQAG